MKKSIAIFIFSFIFLALTGCLGDADYENYMKALEKTDNIGKASSSVNVTVDQIIGEKSNSMKFDMNGYLNEEEDQGIFDIYFYYDDLGTDLSYYRKSENEQYVKLPFEKGYIDVASKSEEMPGLDFKDLSKDISEAWHKMLEEENVFVGEKVTIENEDGEVKARKFTIKPSLEQIDTITDIVKKDILEKEDEIYDFILEFNEKVDFSKEEFKENFEKDLSSMKIVSYEETSYVDSDGYIIDEEINMKVITEGFESKINVKTKLWNIERDVELKFPEISVIKEN